MTATRRGRRVVIAHSNVVRAEERFLAPRPAVASIGRNPRVIRPDFSRPYRTPETEPGYGVSPFFQGLPFVRIKGSGRRARIASYWTDLPTDDGRADFKRGRAYAARVIAAMNADALGGACYLERIIDAIVRDAAARRAKGGKYSRTLPPAVQGFIYDLSRRLASRLDDFG